VHHPNPFAGKISRKPYVELVIVFQFPEESSENVPIGFGVGIEVKVGDGKLTTVGVGDDIGIIVSVCGNSDATGIATATFC